jgi:hypothetical protein
MVLLIFRKCKEYKRKVLDNSDKYVDYLCNRYFKWLDDDLTFPFSKKRWTRVRPSSFSIDPIKDKYNNLVDFISVALATWMTVFMVIMPLSTLINLWVEGFIFGSVLVLTLIFAHPLWVFWTLLFGIIRCQATASFLMDLNFYWPCLIIIDILRGERGSYGMPNFFSEGIKLVACKMQRSKFEEEVFAEIDALMIKYWLWLVKRRDEGTSYKVLAFGFICGSGWAIYECTRIGLKVGKIIMITCFSSIIAYLLWVNKPHNARQFIKLYLITCNKFRKFILNTLVKIVTLYVHIEFSYAKCHFSASKHDFEKKMPNFVTRIFFIESVDLDVRFFESTTRFLRETRTAIAAKILSKAYHMGFIIDKRSQEEMKPRKFRSVYTSFSLEITRKVNQWNIPAFIRGVSDLVDKPSVKDTLDILREIGYPVGDVEEQPPNLNFIPEAKKAWVETGSNFITGLRQLRTFKQPEFDKFRDEIVEYRRSDSFVTIENELESISRYFRKSDVSIDSYDRALDETWELVKEIYQDSRLTPLYPIFKKWKKKYNVGPFAPSGKRQKNGGMRKMKRSEDIQRFDSIHAYLDYWGQLCASFPKISMIASAFYKSEALPPRKWQQDKVRTPIGSLLPQYLWQMLFSNEPNHRFRPETTPVKIGLPLTGYWLAKLFEKHRRFDEHYAGDMTEFDSSITGSVLQAVAAIRKRGYSKHRQYKQICQMIDLNYKKLETSLMVTPSTGNVYRKGSGLTTGHASTSSDNSLVTTFLYISAWVEITGLTAHEFRRFNELSAYGDDHLWSKSKHAPKAWTFKNIQNRMTTWGVQMKDEVPLIEVNVLNEETGLLTKTLIPRDPSNLTALPFLSKFSRKSNNQDKTEWLDAFGTECPDYIVYHDREKLLGKAAAPILTRNPQEKITRLISYLDLCAHHPDVYHMIREAIHIIVDRNKRKNPGLEDVWKKVPTYKQILVRFYNHKTRITEEDTGDLDEGFIVEYGEMTFLDYMTNYLSVLPDVLNPSLQSSGFAKVSQKVLGDLLDWPKELIGVQNSTVTNSELGRLMSSCCYDFLIDRNRVMQTHNNLTLLIRHWCYMALRSNNLAYNPLDYLKWVQTKMAVLQFLINGRLQETYQGYSLPVWNLILISLLNFIVVPDLQITNTAEDDNVAISIGRLISEIKVPDLGYQFGRVQTYLYKTIWLQVPPNFKSLEYLFRPAMMGKQHLITAGTGTGKSTTMILFLEKFMGNLVEKVIVVEPRSLVVHGLVQYTKTLGMDSSGMTSGLKLDLRAKVWYVTAQELLLHPEWCSEDNIIVLDECHINELAYKLVQTLCEMKPPKMLLLTSATPTQEQIDNSYTATDIALPNLFFIDELIVSSMPNAGPGTSGNIIAHTVRGGKATSVVKSALTPIRAGVNRANKQNFWLNVYYREVISIISNSNSHEKYLIYVNDKSDVEYMVNKLPFKVTTVMSGALPDLEADTNFFVATAVADVAITIPGVTTVITTNFWRNIKYHHGTSVPQFCYLDDSRRRQRRGRTGRTNDGRFIEIIFDLGEGNIEHYTDDTIPDQIVRYMSEGNSLSLLGQLRRNWFREIIHQDLTDAEVQELADGLEKLRFDAHLQDQEYRQEIENPPPEYSQTAIRLRGFTGGVLGYSLDFSKIIEQSTNIMRNALSEYGIFNIVRNGSLQEWRDYREAEAMEDYLDAHPEARV